MVRFFGPSLLILLSCFGLYSQQRTVGLFLNTPQAFDGYTLLAGRPNKGATFLIDNCGRIVHDWPILKQPANMAYLTDDGYLVRLTAAQGSSTTFPVDWGRVEKIDWEGNIVWEYTYADSTHLLHHDVEALPNGNMLILAYEMKDGKTVRANGKKKIPAGEPLWSEHLIEIKPVGKDSGIVVWEWHVWDHIIQDHDSTKLHYGKVSRHPELININYPDYSFYGNSDWLHMNSIAYNPKLDQIMLSVRNFSEFWIIDHSTTTAQAASHKGGKYGKGGDLLYRWGNPEAYNRGDSSTRKLFCQHDANWVPANCPGAGNILVFNNGITRPGGEYSSVIEIIPPITINGTYKITDKAFLPETPFWEYKANPVSSFYSSNISSAQRLPNGNTLIVEGIKGNIFEVDNQGKMLWQYIMPIRAGVRLVQGSPSDGNLLFGTDKYPPDHKAFRGKTLKPNGYLEIDPIPDNCGK